LLWFSAARQAGAKRRRRHPGTGRKRRPKLFQPGGSVTAFVPGGRDVLLTCDPAGAATAGKVLGPSISILLGQPTWRPEERQNFASLARLPQGFLGCVSWGHPPAAAVCFQSARSVFQARPRGAQTVGLPPCPERPKDAADGKQCFLRSRHAQACRRWRQAIYGGRALSVSSSKTGYSA